MRLSALLLAFLCAVPAFAQDGPVIDRRALEEFLAGKNLKLDDFGFDFDHLNSMPPQNWASYASPHADLGHLKLYRRIQKMPVTFPDEMLAIVRRLVKGELFEAMGDAIDKPAAAPKLPEPLLLEGLPAELAGPVGVIAAAIAQQDAGTIVAAIEAAKPALLAFAGPVDWEKDGMVVTRDRKPTNPDVKLWIKFGGNDAYTGAWAAGSAQRPVSVVIDTGGDDTYDSGKADVALGGGNGGIGMLVDLAGNDTYRSEGQVAQGAGYHGTGVLIDEAGDDHYVAATFAQGAAEEGFGVLIDRAGKDSYEIGGLGQGYGRPAGFGLLLDAEGNDDYLARDPLYGQPVTNPAAQDAKHNASMAQGAGTGSNQQPLRAGGVGMLLDVKGDDHYRAGCWAQGVGYFLGIGAIVDLAGNDEYQSWIYEMGSGAHGGQGIQIDAQGDDVYRVGAWNSLGMAVDYAIGMFLDGAGNDQYLGSQGGHGTSLGLGIALFQDSAGDDTYAPKDKNLGFGNWYEREDYNSDQAVTPAEKRHWGIFLDLGGMDRYPAEAGGNGKRWDPTPFSGGLDVMTAEEKGRVEAARTKLAQWRARKEVGALEEKKKELDKLRADALAALAGTDAKAADAAVKKLAAAWAARKKISFKTDLRETAQELDKVDATWRTQDPFAAANAGEETLSLENAAATAEERAALTAAPDLAKQPAAVKAMLTAVNEARAMFGRCALAPDESLAKFAAACAKAGKPDGNPEGFAGQAKAFCAKGKSAAEALETMSKAPADHAALLDAKWRVAGAASGAGGWALAVGVGK